MLVPPCRVPEHVTERVTKVRERVRSTQSGSPKPPHAAGEPIKFRQEGTRPYPSKNSSNLYTLQAYNPFASRFQSTLEPQVAPALEHPE
eukprot:8418939-Pyramimonas_sp.AAC.1